MADITVDKALVRPLVGAVVRHFTAGAVMDLGTLAYIDGNRLLQKTDADATATVSGQLVMVVSGANANSAATVAENEVVSGVTFGPVYIGTTTTLDATKTLYASNTPGRIADAVGTVAKVVGEVLDTNIIFFNPVDSVPGSE